MGERIRGGDTSLKQRSLRIKIGRSVCDVGGAREKTEVMGT